MKGLINKHKNAIIVLSITLIIIGTFVFWSYNNPPKFFIKFLATTAVSRNQKQDLWKDDGLYVITTGTGAPMPDKERVSPQTVVVAGNKIFVFDTGPGSTHKFRQTGLNVSDIEALFYTHYHSDHIGDLGELMLTRWATSGPDKPLPIYGPPGLEEVVNGFEIAYTLDKGYRIAHHGEEVVPSSGFGGDVNVFDLGPELTSSKVVYEADDLEIIAFNVDHKPVFPAVGYRVNYKDRSVVITGDTIYTESLVTHSKKADLLVSEAIHLELTDLLGDITSDTDTNATAIAHDVQDYHISPEDAARLAENAEVSQLLLTHILPLLPSNTFFENYFIKDAKKNYNENIYIAHDGTMTKMPVDSNKIVITELFK